MTRDLSDSKIQWQGSQCEFNALVSATESNSLFTLEVLQSFFKGKEVRQEDLDTT